jgi:hypothetical protein
MRRNECRNCGAYHEFCGYSICPACVRQQQDAEKQQSQELARKLLDLAMESVETPSVAMKKFASLIGSPRFQNNIHGLWGDIESNNFLNICYYKLSLGESPSVTSLKSLPQCALVSIKKNMSTFEDLPFRRQVENAYQQYTKEEQERQAKQAAEQARKRDREVEKAAYEAQLEKTRRSEEEKKQKEETRRKQRLEFISLALLGCVLIAVFVMVKRQYARQEQERKTELARREQERAAREKQERDKAPERQNNQSIPVARPSGRYGFVCSPYTGELVDVRGIPRGAKVGDPRTGRAFINP